MHHIIYVIELSYPGNGLLLITATESSAESYYGEQGLYYIGTDGESCLVPRRELPI